MPALSLIADVGHRRTGSDHGMRRADHEIAVTAGRASWAAWNRFDGRDPQ
jgi:hypothetical protein